MKLFILSALVSVGLLSFVGCSSDKPDTTSSQSASMQPDTKSIKSH